MRWRAAPGSPPRVDGKTDGSPRKTLVICRFLQNLSAHRSVCRALRSKSQRGCIIFFTASLAYARLCGALRDDILRHRLALPKTARPACCRRSGDVCKLVHRADYDVDNNPSGLQMKQFMPRWRATALMVCQVCFPGLCVVVFPSGHARAQTPCMPFVVDRMHRQDVYETYVYHRIRIIVPYVCTCTELSVTSCWCLKCDSLMHDIQPKVIAPKQAHTHVSISIYAGSLQVCAGCRTKRIDLKQVMATNPNFGQRTSHHVYRRAPNTDQAFDA